MSTPVVSSTVDLEDLATIDLTDDFIERNIAKELETDFSQRTLQRVCDDFVHAFLVEHGEWITSLHASLGQCDVVLEDIETVLHAFIEQLNSIQRDIGDVREALATKTTELNNTRSAEVLLWATVSRLVVPPEVVSVVTQSNDELLGTQFKMCVTALLRCLRFRSGTWTDDGAIDSVGIGSASSKAAVQASLEEVRNAFIGCEVYGELMSVLDALTVYACVKIKAFLSNKLAILTAPNTNVSIQQEHSLKQYSFYVHFLKSAVPLLCHAHSSGQQGEKQATLIPFRIARALYNEFKSEYCVVMSTVYVQKLQDYAFTCNSLEFSTVTATASGFFGGIGVGGSSSDATSSRFTYQLPTIADATSVNGFALGDRGNLIRHLFDAPLIPAVEYAKRRKHSYEETLRSLISLVCDMVTHEYLFTFRFFSGDMSVYVDVFKPTIQFMVDYVAEVILTRTEGSVKRMMGGRANTSLNVNAKNDCYGLLLMICTCRQYRSMMKFTRKLSCLDGFFDSMLVLLWPAFKLTYDQQLVSLRCTSVEAQLAHLGTKGRLQDKLSAVHPLTRAYTEYACTLTSLCLGTTITEEWRMEAATTRDANVGASGGAASEGGAASAAPPVTDDKGDIACAALREKALAVIREEEEEDTADCASHFSVLLGNLTFLRVEVTHTLQQMATKLVTQESNAELRRVVEPLQCCFLVNNLWHMVHAFSRFPIIIAGEEETVAVGQYGDLASLQSVYEEHRSTFVARLLQLYFPQFDRVVGRTAQLTWQEVENEADSFLGNWKRSIDAMRATTRSLISDPAHEQEILAQACTDCILFNTRFHAAIASCVECNMEHFKDRPLRTLTVSNQTLLQHMRTFASVDSRSGSGGAA